MKMQTAACLAAAMLVGLTGCTTPKASTRGQSIDQAGHQSHNVNTLPNRSGYADSIQNYFHDQHAYPGAASYQSTSGFPGQNGFAGSGGSYAAVAHGACPPGAGCPQGQCGADQCGTGHCPHHYHSYSYQRPQNLVYPEENAVGGSVVYPYYTHKGPSDFFRDDDDAP